MALNFLPQKVAHWWIRRSLDLTIPLNATKIHYAIASSTSDLKSALALVQNNFEREGYAPENSRAIRLTPYHLLPDTVVIVAKIGSRIAATISIIPRTAFGVPLDKCVSLDSFARDKGKMVEVSALAVDPSIRGEQGEVLYNLMKYIYYCNSQLLNANTEVIGVNPKMLPLYEAILLFERIPGAETIAYEFVNGAPVVPMYFNLDTAIKSYEKIYRNQPDRQNVMKFFLNEPPPQFSFPTAAMLAKMLPQKDPEKLKEILQWDPQLLHTLNSVEIETLTSLYSSLPECARLIEEATDVAH